MGLVKTYVDLHMARDNAHTSSATLSLSASVYVWVWQRQGLDAESSTRKDIIWCSQKR